MNVDDLILVSIDDHVVEPPDMFLRHVPAKYRAEAPIVVTDDKGVDQWMYKLRHEIGIDIIAWECDYPHSDVSIRSRAEWARRYAQKHLAESINR